MASSNLNRLTRFAIDQQSLIIHNPRRQPVVPCPAGSNPLEIVIPVSTSESPLESPFYGFPSPLTNQSELRDESWNETPIGHGQMSVFNGGTNSNKTKQPSIELVRDFKNLESWISPLDYDGENLECLSEEEYRRLSSWTISLQRRCLIEDQPNFLSKLEKLKECLELRYSAPLEFPGELPICPNNAISPSSLNQDEIARIQPQPHHLAQQLDPMSIDEINTPNDQSNTNSIDESLELSLGLLNAVHNIGSANSNELSSEITSKLNTVISVLGCIPKQDIIVQQLATIQEFNNKLNDKTEILDLIARVKNIESELVGLSKKTISTSNSLTLHNLDILGRIENTNVKIDRFNQIASETKLSANALTTWLVDLDSRLAALENNALQWNRTPLPSMESGVNRPSCSMESTSITQPASSVTITNIPIYTSMPTRTSMSSISAADIFGIDNTYTSTLKEPMMPTLITVMENAPRVTSRIDSNHQFNMAATNSTIRINNSSPVRVQQQGTSRINENLIRSNSTTSLTSTVSESSLGRVQERRIRRVISEIDSVVSQVIEDNLSDVIIIDLHTNVLRDITKVAKESEDNAIQYSKIPDHDPSLLDLLGDSTSKAYSWINDLKRLYRTRQLHLLSNKNKILIDSISLKKFTGDCSQTIFDFFKAFDDLTKCSHTADQKATLLFGSYLDEKIKQEVALISTDFELLRSHLINKYGKAKHIIEVKLATIKDKKVMDSCPPSKQADHLRLVYSKLAEIQNLHHTSNIPMESIARYAFSHESLSLVVRSLPHLIIKEFFGEIGKIGLEAEDYEGEAAFNILLKFVQVAFKNLTAAAKLSAANVHENVYNDKPKAKVMISDNQMVTSTNHSEGIDVSDNYASSVHFQQSGIEQSAKLWYDPKLMFPCPISKHNHELGSCTEFFKMTVKDRLSVCRSKICFCCLGPWDKCRPSCNRIAAVPVRLVCQDCIVSTNSIQRNILICKSSDHTKPSGSSLAQDIAKYLKGFDQKMMAPLISSSTTKMVAMTKGQKGSKIGESLTMPTFSSAPNPRSVVPVINTRTGNAVDVNRRDIIRESFEEATYILQIFNLRGFDCLSFYDRGANQHLIEGDLAERAKLKVLNPKSVPIGVVGGSRIWTEYGMYSVILGPDNDNKYHELNCQGIKKITGDLPAYDLAALNQEVQACKKLPDGEKLPQSIGGSAINLLIGIKDATLDPVTLWSLPCGLTVYRSQLTDKFGSNICYGGPHSLFTEVNKLVHGEINMINVFFSKLVTDYHNSIYSGLVSQELDYDYDGELPIAKLRYKDNIFCLKADDEAEIAVYPTPITLDDTKIFDPQYIMESDINPNLQSDIQSTPKGMSDINISSNVLNDTNELCKNMENSEPFYKGLGFHHCSVLKAKIPLSRLIKLVDEDDVDKLVNYRCPTCAKCIECLESDRTKTQTLQDRIDQSAIKRSIKVDTEAERVTVAYPWTQDPIKYLTKFHHGATDNYYQAYKAYKQQCRKPQKVKEGIQIAHRELVDKGFMMKLTDLSPQQQNIISSSGFRHHFVWSSVLKDSESTPVRLVVDPSRTGFNHIVAKGENNMAQIIDILIRSRCFSYIFSTDISKLYNQLYLEDSALPFSLFLYSDELNENAEPTVWVLVRAWYGIRSTGNQSGEALIQLANLHSESHPMGKEAVVRDRYVDDIFSGAFSQDELDTKIKETEEILGSGGFSLKFIAKSGNTVPEKASSDMNQLKVLGYKWFPVSDTFSPGFQELNFNAKSRGVKSPNPDPVSSPADVVKILSGLNLTRRVVVAKMAELYDPLGLWEPYKLQLKLDVAQLNGTDWDTPIHPDLCPKWESRFKEFLDIPGIMVPRCVIPDNAVNCQSLRLLCLSDAAASAGGAAIYASYLLNDGSYSCQMLVSKSKLMDMSIPRNELSAVLLMSELAYIVCKSLGSLVEDVYFFTDSTIALCWCTNMNKKLRMFTFNRVTTIRMYIEWATGKSENLPLYHISGSDNIADILTKEHHITPKSLGPSSEWQLGKQWMRLPFVQMPIKRYSDLTLSTMDKDQIAEECFVELDVDYSRLASTVNTVQHQLNGVFGLTCSDNIIHCYSCSSPHSTGIFQCYGLMDISNHCIECMCVQIEACSSFVVTSQPPKCNPLVQIVRLGWHKSVQILTIILKYTAWIVHKVHMRTGRFNLQTTLQEKCMVCRFASQQSKSSNTKITRSSDAEMTKMFFKLNNRSIGENYWFRVASCELESLLSKKSLSSYILENGIYYYTGRLSNEFPVVSADLDINSFFDNKDFNAVTPVVHSSSPVFFAFLIYVHDVLRPHSGVELTYREITKRMHPIGNARAVIAKVRKDCIKCKSMLRLTLELEMAGHSACRTVMAPPFHSIQMDIVYGGFISKAWKKSRQRYEVYGLVIVCLLSSATNILVLEGLESQDIVRALEFHSSIYGAPRNVYVDSGSQLMTMTNANARIRDINSVVFDNLGMIVKVSNPKSHEERGRVEAKVKIIRSMMEKLSVNKSHAMTALSWQTLFSKIASDIDNVPICRGNASNAADFGFDIITPNRLKIGRNNFRALEDSFVLSGATEVDLLEAYRKVQTVWYQILLDRLHYLIPKPKKWLKTDCVNVGAVVIFILKDAGVLKHNTWSLGRVVEADARSLRIEYYGPGKKRLLSVTRCPRQVSVIHDVNDIPINTIEYYEENVVSIGKS